MAGVSTNGVTTALMGSPPGAAMARAVRTGAQPVSMQGAAVKLARIPDGGDLDVSIVPVRFSQDLSDTLGNLGDPNDGMDLLLGDMIATIDADSAGVADSISILGDITNIDYPAFEANTWAPIVGDLATFQSNGDTVLAQFTSDVNPPANPPPPPPAPPPGGGGGLAGCKDTSQCAPGELCINGVCRAPDISA